MLTTVTSTALLEGLRDADNQTVWSDYVDRYRPMLVRYARRLGLPAADADDVAQQALLSFAVAFRDGKYDRGQGKLRSWLFAIMRKRIADWRRMLPRLGRQVAESGDGTGFFARLEDDQHLEELWESEWRKAVLRQCTDEVRSEVQPSTFRAFELFALKGWPAQRVADELEISQNAVFGAKRRVLDRIRELRPQIEEVW